MQNTLLADWPEIAELFRLSCEIDDVVPINDGHINQTYRLTDHSGHWILQQINNQVFSNPLLVQQNFDKVSAHLANSQHYSLENLSAKQTKFGQSLAMINGRSWRVINYIGATKTCRRVLTSQDAFTAASAIGEFDQALASIPVSTITPVIEGFHDLQIRLNQFNRALLRNYQNRVAHCGPELALIRDFAALANWLPNAKAKQLISPRIVHNDTKISNILLCQYTGTARAVIDWDTIMPGYGLFDYGDMVRSFVSINDEDDPQLCEVRWEVLQALTEGYITSSGHSLSEFEKENLLTGAEIIILMVGVRFLTDYFNGDIYFKTENDNQNLQRARTQFELLKQIRASHKTWQQKLGLVKVATSA